MHKYGYLVLFFCSWITSLLLYQNGNDAHFIFDFNMWALHYQDLGWRGITQCFGDGSMHHVGHILPFLIFKFFRYNACAWTLVLTAFHSFNCALLFITINRILSLYQIKNAIQISLLSVCLFLFSPLHTEIVVWGSTVWYQQSLSLVLACIIFMIGYIHSDRGSIIYYYILLVLAFFTWEITFCIPFIALVLLLCARMSSEGKIRFMTRIVLPSLACIGLYMLLNKMRAGAWVSHYGEAAHLSFPVITVTANVIRYLLKLSTINAILSYRYLYAIINAISKPHVAVLTCTVCILLATGIGYAVRKRADINVAWVFLLLSLAALVPVININSAFMKDIEQDRYVYIASAFFYVSVVSIVFTFRSTVLRYLLICGYACLLLVYQHQFVKDWQIAGRVQNRLMDTFRWANADRIIILCSADNVNGAYCLRSQPYSSFGEALQAQRGINVRKKIVEVLQYNLNDISDSMTAVRTDSMSVKTTFTQWGNWYWKNGYSFSGNIEDPDFKMSADEWSHSFITTMSQRKPGDVFIYQAKDHWEEVQ